MHLDSMYVLNFLFAPLYFFENVIPNFFPARCFIFLENFFLTSFPIKIVSFQIVNIYTVGTGTYVCMIEGTIHQRNLTQTQYLAACI